MKTYLDWSAYEDAGMGDAYADIPKTGGNFGKAVAVCIKGDLGGGARREKSQPDHLPAQGDHQ